ncbi:hypothetical protein MF672_004105 [Actinomadura sp. ATCC 31491]|uniref:Uncharacterized protein n=1 Tax=Actinomadura luzonensis TaxID=2805427 RepID=A0ABT0FKY8_9ACTN|nr:hypothetical protein [Actinomadura luzonensis]
MATLRGPGAWPRSVATSSGSSRSGAAQAGAGRAQARATAPPPSAGQIVISARPSSLNSLPTSSGGRSGASAAMTAAWSPRRRASTPVSGSSSPTVTISVPGHTRWSRPGTLVTSTGVTRSRPATIS